MSAKSYDHLNAEIKAIQQHITRDKSNKRFRAVKEVEFFNNLFRFKASNLKAKLARKKQTVMIPTGDLAHISFENVGYCASETILLISTPRSGSTMLSSSIDVLDGGPMAEYCQPHQIIPYLMKMRPQIKKGDKLNPPAYAKYLITLRSGEAKKLCINIHASHIEIMQTLQPYLPTITRKFLLFRRNIIEQSISYYIASVTGCWSSNYNSKVDVVPFDPPEITKKLLSIIQGVKKNIDVFGTSSEIIFYEDYVAKKLSFARMNHLKQSMDGTTATAKQSTKINADFIETYHEWLKKPANKKVQQLISRYAEMIGNIDAN